MVFDIASERKMSLSDHEVKSYVDFCNQNLLELDRFIGFLKKKRFLYLCSPINHEPYILGQNNNYIPIIYKCEVLDIGLQTISIREKSSFVIPGDEQRIKDKYFFRIEKLSGDLSEIYLELFSDDILRLKNRGSIIDYYGDILSVSPEKAAEDLKKYFG